MLAFLQDSSNQRKLAVALAAFLALFSSKIPFLADVNPDQIMWFLGVLAAWIAQSGAKAALQAHAAGNVEAAKIVSAADAAKVLGAVAK